MKKITVLLAIIFLIFNSSPTYANEFILSPAVEYEYYDDGSYTVTSITTQDNTVSLYSTTTTKSKTTTYYNAQNTALWYVTVTGTFTFGNGSAVCNSSSVSAGSYATSWKISNKTTLRNGNHATATAIAKQYYNGKLVKTLSKSVTLTCSSTGVFS